MTRKPRGTPQQLKLKLRRRTKALGQVRDAKGRFIKRASTPEPPVEIEDHVARLNLAIDLAGMTDIEHIEPPPIQAPLDGEIIAPDVALAVDDSWVCPAGIDPSPTTQVLTVPVTTSRPLVTVARSTCQSWSLGDWLITAAMIAGLAWIDPVGVGGGLVLTVWFLLCAIVGNAVGLPEPVGPIAFGLSALALGLGLIWMEPQDLPRHHHPTLHHQLNTRASRP